MNIIVPANPVQLTIYPDRSVTRPVTPVAEQSGQGQNAARRQASTYVYRGELLEAAAGDREFRPANDLQVAPQNRRAIQAYLAVSTAPAVRGRILDGFI